MSAQAPTAQVSEAPAAANAMWFHPATAPVPAARTPAIVMPSAEPT